MAYRNGNTLLLDWLNEFTPHLSALALQNSEQGAREVAILLSKGPIDLRRMAIKSLARYADLGLQRITSSSRNVLEFLATIFMGIKGNDFGDVRAGCLNTCSEYFYRFGEAKKAIPIANEACIVARWAPKPLERRCYGWLGHLHHDVGNSSRALECLLIALSLARNEMDLIGERATWINIAGAFYGLTLYGECTASSRKALGLCKMKHLKQYIKEHQLVALTNIALSALYTRNYQEGILACELASINAQIANPIQRAILESNYTRLIVAAGNLARVQSLSTKVRKSPVLSKSIRADLQADIASGLVEVATGEHRAGLERLHQAYDKTSLHPPAFEDAVHALSDAYRMLGKTRQSLIYAKELSVHRERKREAFLGSAGRINRELVVELVHTAPLKIDSYRLAKRIYH